jgi:hypothetical protein
MIRVHSCEALIKIGERSRLPEICCHCDTVTHRTVTVHRSIAAPDEARPPDGTEAMSSVLLHKTGLLGLVAWLITAILDGSGRGKIKVVVRVRQCRECARKIPVKPSYVDWDYYCMMFLVSRRFAEQYVELNPGAAFMTVEEVLKEEQ